MRPPTAAHDLPQPPAPAALTTPEARASRHLAHLLIVDDEDYVRASLRRLLRREGWRVHAASTPSEAFALLGRYPIGVVLADQRMPGANGFKFLRQVHRQYPQTVRLILSGYCDMTAATAAVKAGAIWRYLAKPWEDEQLREHLRQALALYLGQGLAQQPSGQPPQAPTGCGVGDGPCADRPRGLVPAVPPCSH